jgi:UDP-N-acetyl-2-amino-2-deoxyglucuronate dehydrogenase
MARLRIGMIGCGEIAVRMAAAIASSRHARHVMVMDTQAALAQDLGQQYGVPWTDRVDDLLANPAVDAVYIAVPHHLHASLAMQAAEAGKHILVEKPIAITLPDAEAMISVARANGVWLSVNFHAQVDPLCQAAKELVTTGAIGRVLGTCIVYRGDKPASYWTSGYSGRVATDWRVRKATAGGGVLIMNAIHDLNTMRFITGLEAVRVYAEYGTYDTPVEVEDFIAVTYRYDNDAIGTIEAGSAIRGRDPLHDVDRIYGTGGQILLGEPLQIYTTVATAGLPTNQWQELPVVPLTAEDQQTAMIDGFAGPIVLGDRPTVAAEDGLAVLAIVLAAYQSGAEGRPITLAGQAESAVMATVNRR